MKKGYDFKEGWGKIKKGTVSLAKKGGDGFKKLSHQGKIHFDATALNLRKDRLLYLIGKEYVRTMDHPKKSEQLVELLNELNMINQIHLELKNKAKAS